MMKRNTEIKYFLSGLLIILAYFLPAAVMGENTCVCIHDFLDSTLSHIKAMKDADALFDYSATIPIMGGLPRFIFEPSCNLKIWIYALVSPFWGVLLNYLTVRLTAFIGMFLLLSRYIIPQEDSKVKTCFLASLLFAFLPYYVDYGISSAGIPLVAFAFINLFNRRCLPADFIIMAYYAVNTNLTLGGFFACGMMAIVLLIYVIRTRKFPLWPFLGLCALAIFCIGANWNMIYGFFTNDEPFSRAEYIKPFSIIDLLDGLSVLVISQYHASRFLAVLIVAVFIPVWKKHRKEDKFLDYVMQSFILLVGVIITTMVLKRALNWITLVREFQFDRFFFLYPGMCFVMFAAIALEWYKHHKTKALTILSAVLLVSNLLFDTNFTMNIGHLTGLSDAPDFKEFYDTRLFDDIKQTIGLKEDDKVACVGMYQSVPEYNGIATVDGYIQLYPISYKYKFQKVIQGEIEKSPAIEDYFCNWGSRCYIFSSELGFKYMFRKDSGVSVKNLSIDTAALADLGCDYIFSAVEIENFRELGLEYAGSFSHEHSWWNVRVYRLVSV